MTTPTNDPHSSSLTNHKAEVYRKNASFVYSHAFTAPLLEILKPQQGEAIVDLGCGSGELTEQLAQAVGPSGRILGIDSAADMLEKAKAVTSSCENVSYLPPSDAQFLFEKEIPSDHIHAYDAVFSNAVLHWCKRNPGGVLETCKALLKDDGSGRIAFELGGFMNMIGVRGALHTVLKRRGYQPETLDPWYFPHPDEYKELLTKHGFQPISVSLHPRPTPLPTGIRGWLETFARSTFLSQMTQEEANDIMDEVADLCAPDCRDWRGNWQVMYNRLRVDAVLRPKAAGY